MRLESRLLDLEAERMMAEKELYRFQTLGDKYHKQYEAVVAELQQKQAEQEMIEFSARPKPITKPALGKLSKLWVFRANCEGSMLVTGNHTSFDDTRFKPDTVRVSAGVISGSKFTDLIAVPRSVTTSGALPLNLSLSSSKKPDPYIQFEAVFLRNFVEAFIPESQDGGFLETGGAQDYWHSMFAEELAKVIAERGDIGIANIMRDRYKWQV